VSWLAGSLGVFLPVVLIVLLVTEVLVDIARKRSQSVDSCSYALPVRRAGGVGRRCWQPVRWAGRAFQDPERD
jgi:hypothetical protein